MAIVTQVQTDDDVLKLTQAFEQIDSRFLFPRGPNDALDQAIRLRDSGGLALIAQEGDNVLGYVTADPTRTGYSLSSIHVNRDARGKGIGRTLLAALCEHASEYGAQDIVTTTIANENVRSQQMFEYLGFRLVPRKKGYGAIKLF